MSWNGQVTAAKMIVKSCRSEKEMCSLLLCLLIFAENSLTLPYKLSIFLLLFCIPSNFFYCFAVKIWNCFLEKNEDIVDKIMGEWRCILVVHWCIDDVGCRLLKILHFYFKSITVICTIVNFLFREMQFDRKKRQASRQIDRHFFVLFPGRKK